MIAVTFALPDESRDFRRALRVQEQSGRRAGSWLRATWNEQPLLVWHVGVGRERAADEARLLLAQRPSLVVAAGYAGALDPELQVGDVVIDWRKVERPPGFALPPRAREGAVVTVTTAAETPEAKEQLRAATGGLAVDMETDVLERIFDGAGIPLLALRSISDRAADALPVPMEHWFDLASQRPRVGALLQYLAAHPRQILPFAAFVRGLAPARRHLAQALLALLSSPPE